MQVYDLFYLSSDLFLATNTGTQINLKKRNAVSDLFCNDVFITYHNFCFSFISITAYYLLHSLNSVRWSRLEYLRQLVMNPVT